MTVKDSTVDEEDMFDLVQGLWNSIIGKNFFIDARGGMNKILFPTYFNGGNQQSLTDNATGIIDGNNPSEVIRNRSRYQANATAQYYVDQALGGCHEIRFGFDHSHAVTQNETHRGDQVQTFYDSSQTPRSQSVNIYATPLIDLSALNVTALFAQDSYSVNPLHADRGSALGAPRRVPAGAEQPTEHLLPPDIPGSFPEVRNLVLWHTAGPRVSGVFDVTNDGKTAAKGSFGRYYYVLSTGGGGVNNVNPNSKFQNGE